VDIDTEREHLPLQLVALIPDAIELLALLAELGVLRECCRERDCEEKK
jgi:hypothetical protein